MSKVIVIEYQVSVVDEETNFTEHKIVSSKMTYFTPLAVDTTLLVKRTKDVLNSISFEEQLRLISGTFVALTHQTLMNKKG